MRKDNGLKKGVKTFPVKGVYAYYEIKGLNIGRFMESLKRNGVNLYNVKKTADKKIILAVNAGDAEKLFAINENVWYNTYKIRRIKFGGVNFPLFFLVKNVGIAIGIALFITACVISDDFIFSFSFTGSGSAYKREITEYLAENGISVYSRFSAIDLKTLEDSILSANGNLSFVSCYKSGNRLIINSALSGKKSFRLSGNEEELVSDVSGQIISVKVYRGTAVKSVGDTVNVGDAIVAGYIDVKEVRVNVNVIATATVRYFEDYEITLKEDNDAAALAFAEETAGKIYDGAKIRKTEESGNFIYAVRLYFIRVLTVG